MAANKKHGKSFTVINALQLATLLALLGYMEFTVDTGRVSKVFLASPTSIVREAVKIIGNGLLLKHFWVTIGEVLTGYSIAAVIGIGVGLLWALFPKFESFLNVFCSAIMAVPKVAVLPLLILWFGIGFKSKVVLIVLFSVFQILYNTITGAKQCKSEYLQVSRVFNASKLQTIFSVVLPASLPSMFNGLRISAATALTGVVFSEMQAAKAGLGFLLLESQQLLNTSRMFFLIILVTVISVLFVKLISFIEYILCHKWARV